MDNVHNSRDLLSWQSKTLPQVLGGAIYKQKSRLNNGRLHIIDTSSGSDFKI